MQNALKDQGAGMRAQEAAGTLNTRLSTVKGGPDAWLSNLRKAAYMGTIGNPYSAVLNLVTLLAPLSTLARRILLALSDMFAARHYYDG